MKAYLPSLLLFASTPLIQAASLDPSSIKTEPQFREIYRELVETNTTLSSGSCTLAAERMANRLRQAGFADSDLHVFTDPAHPKEGGLVAVYPGQDAKAKAILLLAHIDVVEAKRADWTRDPFKLVEEDGKFYARGALDDKAQAAIWVDTLVRYRQEHFKPRRTLKLALTCGEEGGAFNGVEWLTSHQRDLIDAEFAVNEGAFGELDAQGNRLALQMQAGEKFYQDYRLEVVNSGGHSSRSVKDNAIYRLADALKKVQAYEFPVQFTDASRAYFAGMAQIQADRGNRDVADAMNAFVKDPGNAQAIAFVSSKDPGWNATLRTTCVATLLDGGHATNALPQRAGANINCRIFPGVSGASVRQKLEEIVADPAVKVIAPNEPHGSAVAPPPLTPRILGPVQELTKQFWPGVPVIPILQPGATDGAVLNAIGIPTYGIAPIFVGADLGNMHGLNEYVGVQSLLEGRAFLYRLIKIYANAK